MLEYFIINRCQAVFYVLRFNFLMSIWLNFIVGYVFCITLTVFAVSFVAESTKHVLYV